jgi:formate hydrogenlyase subunit 3/multisubunit Na+/H+ antiporter MnhD subunit
VEKEGVMQMLLSIAAGMVGVAAVLASEHYGKTDGGGWSIFRYLLLLIALVLAILAGGTRA